MFVKLDNVKSLWIRESKYFAYYLRWRKHVQRPWVLPEHHHATFIAEGVLSLLSYNETTNFSRTGKSGVPVVTSKNGCRDTAKKASVDSGNCSYTRQALFLLDQWKPDVESQPVNAFKNGSASARSPREAQSDPMDIQE